MCLAAGSISITKRCEFAGDDDLMKDSSIAAQLGFTAAGIPVHGAPSPWK